MNTKRCCNELDKLHNDFEKLVKSSLQANSTDTCCKNLKKLRKYFNLILAEIGDDNVFNQNRRTTTRIAKYFGNKLYFGNARMINNGLYPVRYTNGNTENLSISEFKKARALARREKNKNI